MNNFKVRLILFALFTINAAFPVLAQEDDVHPDPLTHAASAMRKRQFRQAEEIYRGLLSQNPGDVYVQQLLSHTLMYQNRYREADSMLRRMHEADTGLPGTYWYMGLSAERQGKDSLAIVNFKTYIRKTPRTDIQNVSAWLHIGSAYRRMMHTKGLNAARTDEMIYYYQQYLELAPTEPHADEIRYFIEQVKMRKPKPGQLLIWTEED